jgi:dienelactone hydrolase
MFSFRLKKAAYAPVKGSKRFLRRSKSWLTSLLWIVGSVSFGPSVQAVPAGPPTACTDRLAQVETPEIRVGPEREMNGVRISEIEFSSPSPSGITANDTVRGDLYVPMGSGPHPAAVVLHGLFAMADARFERSLALTLARSGYVVAFMDLPFHRRRTPSGSSNGGLFIHADLDRTRANVWQAASDASALARWLQGRPDVDPRKVGMVGVSMGGFITHLVMGLNSRIQSGVTFVAGGDVAGLLWKSNAGVARVVRKRLTDAGIDREETARRLAEVEPTAYAACNGPRSVLLVNATDDLIVPRSSADAMARALKSPPQLWLSTNHFGIVLFPDRLGRLTRDYLDDTLNGREFPRSRLPRYAIPALKAGAFIGLESRFTVGLGAEYPLPVSNRPLLSVEGLWTGRGLFAGLATPLTPFIHLGIAWRLASGSSDPVIHTGWTMAF